MSGVDDRVVSMHFNNAEFGRKLSQTIADLQKLKANLDFGAARRNIDELSSAGKKFDMGPMATTIEGVNAKFLAMATIGITALTNIASAAVRTGAQIASSFTLDPAKAGFSEYELKLGSIQTILANTSKYGTSLEDVTGALNELNEYSDKTIYNFGDMTKNIGLFTNAGLRVEEATTMIKGFSNAAAASGTNAEGAAGAAYQLSQALSAGTVRLMDWRSLTNVGMGNKNMQDSLIQLADKMGTLTKNGIDATYVQNDFNGSLEKNWLSADVMSTYLKIMSGDMDDASIAALGFNEAQVAAFKASAQTALEAATKVRTLTQLMGTVKESIGSGWAQSAEIVLGNFDEATALFTGINKFIGDMVGAQATARNELLQGWKAFGGRDLLIDSFKTMVKAVQDIIAPIKWAFREMFPATTVSTLLAMTAKFRMFAEWLKIGGDTAQKIRNIFGGFFAVIRIGFEIFQGLYEVVKTVFKSLMPAGSGIVTVFSGIGESLIALKFALVDGGKISDVFQGISTAISGVIEFITGFVKGVAEFIDQSGVIPEIGNRISQAFDKIKESASGPVEFITKLKDSLFGLFGKGGEGAAAGVSGGAAGAASGFDTVKESLESVTDATDKASDAWDGFKDRFARAFEIISNIGNKIKEIFANIGEAIGAGLSNANFDTGLDVMKVGLLGALTGIMYKIFKGGLKIDWTGGLMEKLDTMFKQLTSTLKALETNIKADTLMKIAKAMGILTISIVALSFIDAAALAKSLTAMAVGFGELMATLKLMEGLNIDAGQMATLAGGMIGLALAMGLMAISIRILSGLKADELATGILGIAGAMTTMVVALKNLRVSEDDMIQSVTPLILMAGALILLSFAVKKFGQMDPKELITGMLGVGTALGILIVALRNIPKGSTAASGLAVLLVAQGVRKLADAVIAFGSIDWQTMIQGLLGMGIALKTLTWALKGFQSSIEGALAIFIIAPALWVLAEVVEKFGSMDLETMIKGLLGLVVALGAVTAAMYFMQGALPGAAALLIIAPALWLLAEVIQKIGSMDLMTLVIGIAAIVVVLAVLAGVSLLLAPAVPTLLALGIALAALGAAFALFGVGAYLTARALEIMATVGVKGIQAMVDGLDILIRALPKIVTAIVEASLQFVTGFLSGMAEFIPLVVKLLGMVLDAVIELVPKVVEALRVLLTALVDLAMTFIGPFAGVGFEFLMAILRGIRDNIQEVATIAIDIITNLINGLAEGIPRFVEALGNFILEVLKSVAFFIGKQQTAFIPIGKALIDGFLTGLQENVGGLFTWFTELPGKIIGIIKSLFGIESPSTVFFDLALDILKGLLNGLISFVPFIIEWWFLLPWKILAALGDLTATLLPKGIELLVGLLTGIIEKWIEINEWFGRVGLMVLGAIGDLLLTLKDKGIDLLKGLKDGAIEGFKIVTDWLLTLATEILKFAFVNPLDILKDVGKKIMEGLKAGLEEAWNKVTDFLSGLNPANWKGPPERDEKMLVENGILIMQGLLNGLTTGWNTVTDWLQEVDPSDHLVFDPNVVSKMIHDLSQNLPDEENFNPTITPVLDLTRVQEEAGNIAKLMKTSTITPSVSFAQAREISFAGALNPSSDDVVSSTTPNEITFIQNNTSPKALNASEIYNKTRSQIHLAKEKLGIQ